ncbi:Extracellular ligand-binding receptor [Chthoniobacter flavus Ellin428]|uniref:Extracellular ligand-binding receptor n=1 Tax=Chthoniobacter flavus Ellin428 TaxID=497964 RepID=B4CXG9_9BACT|nr:ABC transporter substrate-binding protein [Chthoniobacter flavus]EDY20967.1 Extracellular ligand-binding receptor [Chthoniobacter flavus Ellin428]TCO88695.1 amino acid/amide ABC transporter substrate-binding protein (HAAT family) [Chthoniobacter flavus]
MNPRALPSHYLELIRDRFIFLASSPARLWKVKSGRGWPTARPGVLFALLTAAFLGLATFEANGVQKVEIAAALSITGDSSSFGGGSLEGIKAAIDEANRSGFGPRIELKVYDDRSTADGAREVAAKIAASDAVLTLGPAISVASLAAGPIYAKAGLASITTTATSDLITDNPTTFRILFKNSDQGEMLATFLAYVLGLKRAAVMVMDDGYGRTIEKGFRDTAERLGIEANYYILKPGEPMDEAARKAVAESAERPVVLAMLDTEGARLLTILRRLGVKGPFLGGDAFGIENFNSHFADTPEEKQHPGYFCENLYGITPMLLDSANADILAFAERFKQQVGHDPGWLAVAGFDAARLAIETIRKTAAADPGATTSALRTSALHNLLALDKQGSPLPGLLGPFVFDSGRGRQTALRIGRFNHGRFESAPLQIVPVLHPHEAEVESGAVFELRPGNYVRLQQVIYSGLYLNELMWIDQAHFTFGADFYVWLRFAKGAGAEAADPTEIKFPDLSTGHFDREHPVEQREMADGTSYRLWRVQGEFRSPFDLHHYPFDRQSLTLRFYNARAAADRIVYALDESAPDTMDSRSVTPSGVSAEAFRGLSQWKFVSAHQWRQNFVAKSSLGDPLRIGLQNYRELSGHAVTIELQRRSLTTLMKTLLPLWLMTCILYASLYFPPVLVQPKIGVAMTAVLTGMVLLNLVNSQLGAIGYTVAVEYAFYVYFALGLLQIVSVLLSEHLRGLGRTAAADRSDRWTRVLFIGAVVGLIAAAVIYE